MTDICDRLNYALKDVETGEWLRSGVYAHATVEEVAEARDEIRRLRKIEAAARNVANTLNGGFVACPCGRQESTTDLDFTDDLYAVLGVEKADY